MAWSIVSLLIGGGGRRRRRKSERQRPSDGPPIPGITQLSMYSTGYVRPGVLGDAVIIIIDFPTIGIDDDVLQDRSEPNGVPNLRLSFPGQLNGLRVTATLEIEDAVVVQPCSSSPMRTPFRIGGEGRLPRARKAEKQGRGAVLPPMLDEQCIGQMPFWGRR